MIKVKRGMINPAPIKPMIHHVTRIKASIFDWSHQTGLHHVDVVDQPKRPSGGERKFGKKADL